MRVLPLLLAAAGAAAALDCPKGEHRVVTRGRHGAPPTGDYSVLNLEKGKNNLIHTTRILYPNAPGGVSALGENQATTVSP
eukprot:gene5376-23190_t